MMTSSQKMNEIVNSMESFGDKCGLGYNEEVSTSTMIEPIFFKVTTLEPKLKLVVTTPKGKFIVMFQPISYSKVNTWLKASYSQCFSSGLLPLPTVSSMCYHYGE